MSLLASTSLLAACNQQPQQAAWNQPPPPQPVAYNSVAQCVADGNDYNLCNAAAAQMQAQAANNNAATMMMVGFMLGQSSSYDTVRHVYVYHNPTVVYRTAGGAYYAGSRPINSAPRLYSQGARAYVRTTSTPYVNRATGQITPVRQPFRATQTVNTPYRANNTVRTQASPYRGPFAGGSASSAYRPSSSSSSSGYRSSSSSSSSYRHR